MTLPSNAVIHCVNIVAFCPTYRLQLYFFAVKKHTCRELLTEMTSVSHRLQMLTSSSACLVCRIDRRIIDAAKRYQCERPAAGDIEKVLLISDKNCSQLTMFILYVAGVHAILE